MSTSGARIYNSLITTHHITSRRKVQRIREAARRYYPLHVLLCSGGCPGIMYAEGAESNVQQWVAAVKNLRYKDFKLARRPAPITADWDITEQFEEVNTVKEFATMMNDRCLLEWWRNGMGYTENFI